MLQHEKRVKNLCELCFGRELDLAFVFVPCWVPPAYLIEMAAATPTPPPRQRGGDTSYLPH